MVVIMPTYVKIERDSIDDTVPTPLDYLFPYDSDVSYSQFQIQNVILMNLKTIYSRNPTLSGSNSTFGVYCIYSKVNGEKCLFGKNQVVNPDDANDVDYWKSRISEITGDDTSLFPSFIEIYSISGGFDMRYAENLFLNVIIGENILVHKIFEKLRTSSKNRQKSRIMRTRMSTISPEQNLRDSIAQGMESISDRLSDTDEYSFLIPNSPVLSFNYDVDNNGIQIVENSFSSEDGTQIMPFHQRMIQTLVDMIYYSGTGIFKGFNPNEEIDEFVPGFAVYREGIGRYIITFNDGRAEVYHYSRPDSNAYNNLRLTELIGEEL